MEKIFCQDIEDSEFARLDDSEKDSEFVAVESKTYFQDAWGRFKKNKLALVSLVFMAVMHFQMRHTGLELINLAAIFLYVLCTVQEFHCQLVLQRHY